MVEGVFCPRALFDKLFPLGIGRHAPQAAEGTLCHISRVVAGDVRADMLCEGITLYKFTCFFIQMCTIVCGNICIFAVR